SGTRFYSPLVLNIARTEGISMTELEQITGSGNEGRVTKKDMLAYVANRGNGQSTAPQPADSPATAIKVNEQPKIHAPAVSLNAGDEVVEMDRMRKLIADHMVMSKHTSPHVTSFVEADVTNLVTWRN